VIRLKKIRNSARGQDCTVNSPWCNYDPDTVVFAHYGEPGEKGMGLKPDDTSGAYACSSCHDWLDGRAGSIRDGDRTWYWFRAMRRTWKLFIENGVLK
jgi:hypothetical protein